MSRARVSTLAQWNGSAALTVESSGTNEPITNQPHLSGQGSLDGLAHFILQEY